MRRPLATRESAGATPMAPGGMTMTMPPPGETPAPRARAPWQRAAARAVVAAAAVFAAVLVTASVLDAMIAGPAGGGGLELENLVEVDGADLERPAATPEPQQMLRAQIARRPETTSEPAGFRLRASYLSFLARAFKSTECHASPVYGLERPDAKQVCCITMSKPDDQSSTCLPNLVVMGAQKGGTTALHSYLMLHPQMAAPRKKELHIFDMERNFQGWPSQIKLAFKSLKQSSPSSQRQAIRFESTPSYMASTLACERMSTILPPWAVYVLILRDPVKRLWSEYNMKARRIHNQDVTLRSIIDNADNLAACWTPVEGDAAASRDADDDDDDDDDDDEGGVKQAKAWGASARQNGSRRSKSPLEALKSDRANVRDDGQVNNAERLRKEDCRSALHKHLMGSRIKISQVSRRMTDLKFALEMKANCIDSAKAGATIEESRACVSKMGILRESLPDIRADILAESKALQPCVNLSGRRQFLEATSSVSGTPWTEADRACEKTLRESFCQHCGSEADHAGCTQECFRNHNATVREAALRTGCKLPDVSRYPPRDLRRNSACSGELCTCYPAANNMADISKNFLWRGLYFPQVQQCLRYIPRSQLIILDNDDLRRDPAHSIQKITSKLGLRQLPYGSKGFTYADASQEFTLRYPEFATSTGWASDGSLSVPMPSDVELMLRKFYAEPNKKLFELIGRTFDHWT